MKKLGYFVLFLLFCFVGICLRPVPALTEDNAQTQIGVVENVSEGGVKDAVFHLVNDDHHYYINRGLDNRSDLEALRKKCIGKEVTFTYVVHWTPLDWDNKSTHIAKLELGEEIIYDETN